MYEFGWVPKAEADLFCHTANSYAALRSEGRHGKDRGQPPENPMEKPTAIELVRLMGQDKKVRDGRLTFILVRGIGQAFITRDVEAHEVLAFLSREFEE